MTLKCGSRLWRAGKTYTGETHIRKSFRAKDKQHTNQAQPWEQRKLDDMCSIITKQTGFDYSYSLS